MTWALISPHPRANRAIAEFLDTPLHELWPQWFDADGKLISTKPISRAIQRPLDRISRGSHPSRPRRRAA